MAQSMVAAAAKLKEELAAAKLAIPAPIQQQFAALQSATTRDEAVFALQTVYSEQEKETLRQANKQVLGRYRFTCRQDIVPIKQPPPLKRASGSDSTAQSFQVALLYSDDESKLLQAATAKVVQGKTEIDLRCADLSGIDFRFVEADDIAGVHFGGANLKEANFDGANLKSVKFWGAKLWGAKFWGSALQAAEFQGLPSEEETRAAEYTEWQKMAAAVATQGDAAGVQEQDFMAGLAALSDQTNHPLFFVAADLQGAIFHGSSLTDALFCASDLRAAQMQASSLKGANLESACIQQADFRGASCTKANFSDVEYTPLPPLAFAARSRNALGALLRMVVSGLRFRAHDDDDDDNDDEADGADEADEPDIEQGTSLCGSLCGGAVQSIEDKASERLLGAVEQGGDRIGESVIAAVGSIETKFQQLQRSLDKAAAVKLDAMLKGVKAQAAETKKAFEETDAVEGLSSFTSSVESITKASQRSVQKMEESFRSAMLPSALLKFATSQLKQRTEYDPGLWNTFKAVLTTSPVKLTHDTKETKRILEKLKEISRAEIHIETWDEVADMWIQLRQIASTTECGRVQIILDLVFNDLITSRAVISAAQFLCVAPGGAPSEVILLLKQAKGQLRHSLDEYIEVADKELARIEAIQAKQTQVVGLLIVVLGNFLSNVVYSRLAKYMDLRP